MRKTIIVVGLLAVAAVWSSGQAAMTNYKATLAGTTEVPPTTSQGTGSAAVSGAARTQSSCAATVSVARVMSIPSAQNGSA